MAEEQLLQSFLCLPGTASDYGLLGSLWARLAPTQGILQIIHLWIANVEVKRVSPEDTGVWEEVMHWDLLLKDQSCSVLNMLQARGACSNIHGTWELHDKGEAMQLLSLADFWLRAITLHGVTYSWPKKVGRPGVTAWASYSYLITPTSSSHRINHCFMQSPRWFQAYLVTQSEAICPLSWWFRNSPWV